MKDTLTYKDIEKAIKEIEKYEPPMRGQYNPFLFNGMPIHEAKVRMIPKIQVSEEFKWITDKDRKRINAKLAEMLGYREQCAVPKDVACYIFNNSIIARPEFIVALNTVA